MFGYKLKAYKILWHILALWFSLFSDVFLLLCIKSVILKADRWVLVPALLQTSLCDQLLNLSRLLVSHLYNGNSNDYLRDLL